MVTVNNQNDEIALNKKNTALVLFQSIENLLEEIIAKALKRSIATSFPESQDNLLTVDETALRLNVSTMTVRRMISSNRLKSIRCLGAIRIRESDLAAFIKGDHD